MSPSAYAKTRLADEFLRQAAAQKRRFTIAMSIIIALAACLQAFLRLKHGFPIAAAFSMSMATAAILTLILGILRKQNWASHIILTAGLIATGANQYATGSANVGPIVSAFTVLAAAMYLLSSRWGLFYGLLAFTRVFVIKALAHTGILAASPIPPSVAEWYASMVPACVVFFFVTVAAKRNTERLLTLYREAAETRIRFLSRMSHEIRTPLNGILGLSNILAEKADDEEHKEFLKIIIRSGHHLLYVVNRILEISRVEHKIHAENEAYSPAALLEQVVDFVRPEIRQKNISVSLHVNPDVPETLFGDTGGIRQILANLVNNAVKYTEQGSIDLHVKIDGVLSSQYVTYSVSDTGRGISQKKLNDVFEAFEQGDFSTPVDRGVGLGLTICRELCQTMGGTIRLESQIGKGSTFTVRLPVMPATQYSVQSQPRLVTPQPGIKVLYVEDDEVNRILMETMLRTEGMQLSVSPDGKSGLAEFARNNFDIVLTDIHMPEVDGFALFSGIRNYEAAQNRKPVPIIAVSANVIPEEIARALDYGFYAYIEKPFSRERILAALADAALNRVPAT